MTPLLKSLRYLTRALVEFDGPPHLAAGFALGLAVGLIPKTSLLAKLGLVAISAVKVNMAAAYLAMTAASALAPLADPLAHAVGHLLLVKAAFLKPLWTRAYNMPIVPWTGFYNTVTLGWTVLGAALAYPAYRVSLPIIERHKKDWAERLRRVKR